MMVRMISPLLALMVAIPAYSQKASHSAAEQIEAAGCVQSGVEHNCTMLQDRDTGQTYNLTFEGGVPKPGTGIEFEGTSHSGITTCMQGKPVDVKKWKRVKKMKCPASQEDEHTK